MTKSEIKENLIRLFGCSDNCVSFEKLLASFFNVDEKIAQIINRNLNDMDKRAELIFAEQNRLEWSENHVLFMAKAIYASAWDVVYNNLDWHFEKRKQDKSMTFEYEYEHVFSMMGMSLSILFAQITRGGIGEGDIRSIEIKSNTFEDHLIDKIKHSSKIPEIKAMDELIQEFSKEFTNMVFSKQDNEDAIYVEDKIVSDPAWLT